MDVKIETSWKEQLKGEFSKTYFQQLTQFLKTEVLLGKKVFPPGPLIFRAFNETPFAAVKVVLLGQDPYHSFGQAEGLSFSVAPGQRLPPSLQNIYKELEADLGVQMPRNYGCLTSWAQQGVLLLNAYLTVREGEPASHSQSGWATFTDAAIRKLSEERDNLVFLLWGNFAQQKQQYIDQTKHLVLKTVHPSPLSAHRGFLGSKHFSQTNTYLVDHNISPIDWKIILE